MDAKYTWKNPGYEQTDDHPVVLTSHNDAAAFISWLNKKDQRAGQYGLLREAEFEYASRSGTQSEFPHGDDPEQLVRFGNVPDRTAKNHIPGGRLAFNATAAEDGYCFTAPVGKFQANHFGLYDMVGNVGEWIEDWYDSQYYQKGENNNPRGPSTGQFRVKRGSSFCFDYRYCRSSMRGRGHPAYRHFNTGFRVCFRPD
jgi:formylglycine-generating enzyme required for sulfatase activity